jgi:tRNA threonylcarbamoyl adenosine modification protein YjeE
VTTHSEAETADVGRDLARRLGAGDVVLLYGDLGAGKTAFVKGLAEGLGAARDDVSSPTFTLMQEYRGGRLTLFHVDLYRLDDPREVADLGLDEIAADREARRRGFAAVRPHRRPHRPRRGRRADDHNYRLTAAPRRSAPRQQRMTTWMGYRF